MKKGSKHRLPPIRPELLHLGWQKLLDARGLPVVRGYSRVLHSFIGTGVVCLSDSRLFTLGGVFIVLGHPPHAPFLSGSSRSDGIGVAASCGRGTTGSHWYKPAKDPRGASFGRRTGLGHCASIDGLGGPRSRQCPIRRQGSSGYRGSTSASSSITKTPGCWQSPVSFLVAGFSNSSRGR